MRSSYSFRYVCVTCTAGIIVHIANLYPCLPEPTIYIDITFRPLTFIAQTVNEFLSQGIYYAFATGFSS
ncbi:hypothetical protein SK128_010274 [Halocaridina rubra]|uniref:Uncharacterized protein n=1 Tax=Halocaridina rubra TaxID=373956 RepID=A0AAN8X0Q9_HALRR